MKRLIIILIFSILVSEKALSSEIEKPIYLEDGDAVWINMLGGTYEYNSGNPYDQPNGKFMKYPKTAIKYCESRNKKTFHVTGDFIAWYNYVFVKNYGFVRFICANDTKEVKNKLIELIKKDTQINLDSGDKIFKKFNKIRKKDSQTALKQITKNGIPWSCEVEYYGAPSWQRSIKKIQSYKTTSLCTNIEKPYDYIYQRYSFQSKRTNIILFNEDPKIISEQQSKIAEAKKKEELKKKEKERQAKLDKGCIWAVINEENDASRKIYDWVCDKEKVAEIKKKIDKEEEEKKIAEEKKKKEEEKQRVAEEKERKKNSIKISSKVDPSLLTIGSGSGFYINNEGYALTNNHVIDICKQSVAVIDGEETLFRVIAADKTNDVAVLKTDYKSKNYIKINEDGAKLGENVIAVGYPLAGRLSDSVKITRGIVSSLSGLDNNSSQIQIDAALQPGNSGGPVLNEDGELVGIASAGLNKLLMAKEAKYIPENVNFAVASQIVVNILKSQKVKYSTPSIFSGSYSNTELADLGDSSTIQLFCRNTRTAYNKLKSNNNYSTILLDLD